MKKHRECFSIYNTPQNTIFKSNLSYQCHIKNIPRFTALKSKNFANCNVKPNPPMTRKTTDGPLRNKERTKKAMISAVGKILVKEGFTGLNVSKVAAKANIDRKLIYDYFGGMEGLVKEYLNTRDFWASNTEQIEQAIPENTADIGKAATCDILEQQFDALMENAEMRSIITWALCQDLKPLRELNEAREELAEAFFTNLADAYFKDKDKNFRAVVAILISANYYMTLISQVNGSKICGIDIQKTEDQEAIKKTFRQIIDWAYA